MVLDSLDGATHYARWIYELAKPHLGHDVLEVGAGHGTFTELIARDRRVVATDASERCVGILSARYADVPQVHVRHADLEESASSGPYDSAVLINVLEHVEDDATAVKQLREALRPDGNLLLWVPAFTTLYSDFDRKVGHYRRYRLSSLTQLLCNAGFDIVEARYVNTVGAVAWWVVARQLGRTPTKKPGLQAFDKLVVPLMRRVESGLNPPFGQSIFCVARPHS
jgi:SAM-dependent methyltransferase